MIKEDGVHGLAHVVVAAEGEREVADATADLRPGQVLLNPTDGANEIQSVAVMLGHTRCDGQDVGVEDDVLRREAGLLGEQSVGALTDGDLTLEDVRLTRLVEGHHDRSGPQSTHTPGMTEKLLLALLQTDRVDDALALYAHQPLLYDAPFRGVDHNRHAGDVRLRGDQVEEDAHLILGLQQAVVHVDVEHLRAVLHLLAGDGERLLVLLLLDQSEELARAGHVASLADVEEVVFRLHLQQIQSGEPERVGLGRCGRHMRPFATRQLGEVGYVCRRRATASPDDIHESLVDKILDLHGHLLRRLVVLSELVRQARVGVGADVEWRQIAHLLEVRLHVGRAEGAVQADAQQRDVLHRGEEGAERLTREGAPALARKRKRKHDRQLATLVVHRLNGRLEARLGVERIESRLEEDHVHAAIHERIDLLVVGAEEVGVRHGAIGRIAHIGTHRGRFVRRP